MIKKVTQHLSWNEPLLFERSSPGKRGYQLPELDVPPVEGTDPETDETALRRAADDQPFSALAFKIMSDPFVGHVTYIRVYSGVLKSGSYVINSGKGSRERISRRDLRRRHLRMRRSQERQHRRYALR